MKSKIFFTLMLAISKTAFAAPVEFDIPEAHIIVVRPIDGYGVGTPVDKEKIYKGFLEKKYAFSLPVDGERFLATDNNPIPMAIAENAQKIGFEPVSGTFMSSGLQNIFSNPQTLMPAEANAFIAVQNRVWKESVLQMGNPRDLLTKFENRQSVTNWTAGLGMLVGAVGGAYAGKAIGAPIGASGGATIGGQIGLSSDQLLAAQKYKDLFSLDQLPIVDLSKYKSVDVRKASIHWQEKDRFTGHLIIAYKSEKTTEAEKAALIAGIPVLLGFDQTPEQVKQARQEDFNARAKLWAECVAAGQCKSE